MRKMSLAFLGALFLAAVFVVGCGDDDDNCPECPEILQKAIFVGSVQLDEGKLDFSAFMVGVDGRSPDVDSVTIHGYHVDRERMYGEMGNGWYFRYEQPEGALSSGDDAVMNIFTPGGNAACTLTILDDIVDRPEISEWGIDWPFDTVAISTGITVSWAAVPAAEWYLIYRSYSYDSLGASEYYSDAWLTTSTSFSIPASTVKYDGYFDIEVTSMTGARPDADEGNVQGTAVRGVLNSYSRVDFRVYVGTGNAWPKPAVSSVPEYQTPPGILESIRDMWGY